MSTTTKEEKESPKTKMSDEIPSSNTKQKQSKKSTKVVVSKDAVFVPSKSNRTDPDAEERVVNVDTDCNSKEGDKNNKKNILDINSNQKSKGKQKKFDVLSEKKLVESETKNYGKAAHPSYVIGNEDKDFEEAASTVKGDSDVTTSNKPLITKNIASKTSKQESAKSTESGNKKTKGRKSNKKVRGVKDQEIPDKKQSSLTDHFPVRRSERKIKTFCENEALLALEKQILSGIEDGLEIKVMEDKGRGIFSAKTFMKNSFVCEYAGELIDYKDAKEREAEYEKDPDIGSYMYFFQYKEKKYCVDATKETSRLGRLLNHSKTDSNVYTKLFPINDVPHLILVASRDIEIGEELLYDYGDRSKKAVEHHPWLKS